MKYQHFIFVIFAIIIIGFAQDQTITNCTTLPFLPMPKNITCSLLPNTVQLRKPCNILYAIKNSQQGSYKHFVQLIEHQQLKTFDCHNSHVLMGQLLTYKPIGFQYQVDIQVQNTQLRSVFTKQEQKYKITIQKSKTTIEARTYVGFVRALETFMQSITCNKKRNNCTLSHTPIIIQDEPAFSYRGLMIDTARHYQPINLIYQTIDALMYNKMSILHWHIVDEDSFPLKLDSHPQLAEYGAFSKEEIYTTDQVRDLVQYAKVRGVRIIPELDTPGHAAIWGKAPQNSKVACVFGGVGYMGPLDVTLDQTYQLVKQVFKQIFQLFPDPVVHLGGDQVMLTCLSNKTQFVLKERIQQQDIQLHYRRKQKAMLKQINPNKKFMYWMNSQIKLQKDDIVHWWGAGIPQTQCQIVISNYGPYYIDMGVGNYFGFNYGSYVTWLQLYNQDLGKMISTVSNKQKIIGAQVTLWSQLSNRYTHHTKIWIRTSSLAERTWTIANYPAKPQFLARLTTHERLMKLRGIPTAPATCQQCELNPSFC